MGLQIWTVGHGTLTAAAFSELVATAGLTQIVDVRAYPGSRRHPHFGRDSMGEWLPAAGVAYRWEPRLGGRRKASPGSRHLGLINDAFRAYADHMETETFGHGLDALIAAAAGRPSAIMCAEALWWRCHRRLIADALVLVRDVAVSHLMQDGRTAEHVPTDGVRVDGDALVYDVGATGRLL